MKPVRKVQRYRCDYCAKTLTRKAMERHEEICFKNPDRKCPMCEDGGGRIWVAGDGKTEPAYYVDCDICKSMEEAGGQVWAITT